MKEDLEVRKKAECFPEMVLKHAHTARHSPQIRTFTIVNKQLNL